MDLPVYVIQQLSFAIPILPGNQVDKQTHIKTAVNSK